MAIAPPADRPIDVDAPGVEAVVGDHPVDHLSDREGLAGAAASVAGRKPVEAAFGLLACRCSGSSRAKPKREARSDQPQARSKAAALWVQPCSTTTSGAPGGNPSGRWTSMRSAPGLAPKSAISVKPASGASASIRRGNVCGHTEGRPPSAPLTDPPLLLADQIGDGLPNRATAFPLVLAVPHQPRDRRYAWSR